jgi:predicted nucleic acid-binding protein
MNQSRLVDTNLIVRHLTQDHPKHAAIAAKLFEACDRGMLTLVVLPMVLAECVFVLESFYELPRERIGAALAALISSPGIEIDNLPTYLDALDRYVRLPKLHFVDCTLAASAIERKIAVATFDAGLQKVAGIKIDLNI